MASDGAFIYNAVENEDIVFYFVKTVTLAIDERKRISIHISYRDFSSPLNHHVFFQKEWGRQNPDTAAPYGFSF